MNDFELIQAFAADGSQEAFAELVRRHVDAVYASAKRQAPTMADDITQAVFVVLARRAGSLDARGPLAGWLIKTTYFAAKDAIRAERRRHRHEQKAAEARMQTIPGTSEETVQAEWNRIEPALDDAMMRLVDFLYGLPYMFLVILIMLLFSETARGEMLPVFLALGLVQWLTMARIVRGQVLTLRRQEFVLAAELLGASDLRILVRHVLPNVVGVIVVYATLMVPSVIILESFLSFLGLGVALSWGQLVSDGVAVVNPVRSYWWLLLWPSSFLGLTLLSLNFIGDGLRDALDPKSRL